MMKRNAPKLTYLTLLFFVSINFAFVACSSDEELIDLVGLEDPKPPVEQEKDGTDDGEETEPDGNGNDEEVDNGPDFESKDGLPINTTPCDFLLSEVASNSTVEITCQMDLNGQSVTIPNGVVLSYDGGEIINGTLTFSGQGIIDGRLLNKDLKVEGDVSLEDKTFLFYPERWNFVQGQITSEIGISNRDELEEIFEMVKRLNGHTAKLDKVDAYFEVSKVTSGTTNQNFYASTEAINVPSDFNLIMTENTVLRVLPNSRKEYALLGVHDAENVKIEGGVLIGDRDQHNYGQEHQEWGYLIFLRAARNTTVTGVTMKNSMGDGMKIQSLLFYYNPDHIAAENITVTKCIFDSNRRNNLSITGGRNILIHDNVFMNASVDTNFSEGVAPGFAIDVEATRTRQDDGTLLYYERAEDIMISNNIEKGSRMGGFTVAIGYDVTIQNNTVETGISYSLANGTRIIGNTIHATSSTHQESGTGIKAGKSNSDDATIYGNEISGNTVIGFGTGIRVTNKETIVNENKVENAKVGISLVKLTDSNISSNIVNSTRDGSIGVSITSTTLIGVVISNNQISVRNKAMKIFRANSDAAENDRILIKENVLSTPDKTFIDESNRLDFVDNKFDHGIEIFSSEDITFNGNGINSGDDHGFDLRQANYSIEINNNTIDVDSGLECIRIENTTSKSQVADTNNNCI